MAQQLRAPDTLLEVLGSLPGTHMTAQGLLKLQFKESSMGTKHVHGVHASKHSYIK